MSTQNALNQQSTTFTVGTTISTNNLFIDRSASGLWINMDDQTDSFGYYNNAGNPEGVVAANIGAVCTDTTNGILYVKQTDTVNTGWAVVGGQTGSLVQKQIATSTTFQTSAVIIPVDDTIPQITEGVEHLTVAITPTDVNNVLNIDFNCMMGTAAASANCVVAIFQDATADALYGNIFNKPGVAFGFAPLTGIFSIVAGTTSATTFRLRFGPGSATTIAMNGLSTGRFLGGVSVTTLSVEEVLP